MNTLHTGYNKEKVETSKWGIQGILDVLNPRGSPLDENLSTVESATLVAPVAPGDTVTTSVAKTGASPARLVWSYTEY